MVSILAICYAIFTFANRNLFRKSTLSHHELIGPNVNASNEQIGGSSAIGFRFAENKTGGLRHGVQSLLLRCGDNSVEILPTRGMGIAEAISRGTRFGWDSPVQGPVHPMWVPLDEPSGLGWLDGFDEMMVRCGLVNNGAPDFDAHGNLIYPLHGRIANLPAVSVAVEIDEANGTIVAKGTVLESRFHFHRWQLETEMRLRLDSNEIEIVDRVTNLSDRVCSFQMLYHNNFGAPVLEAGSKFHAAAKRVAPRDEHAAVGIEDWNLISAPNADYAEEVFFLDLASDEGGFSKVVLANADESLAASIRYDTATMPCFSLWKNTVGENDGYVCGLEPATNFPNPRSFEQRHGRVVVVQPRQSVELKLAIGMLVGKQPVAESIKEVDSLRRGPVEVLRDPQPDWSKLS